MTDDRRGEALQPRRWPAQAAETQYLRVYVGHLRQKLEDNPDDPKVILTELGIGYRLAEA